MGICLETSEVSKIKSKQKSNLSASRESFLFNSFSYDVTHKPKEGFFAFDLEGYCEIQYILRKKTIPEKGEEFTSNLKFHIEAIDQFLERLRLEKEKPSEQIGETLESVNEKFNEQENKNNSKNLIRHNSNQVFKLEIFGASLNDFEDEEDVVLVVWFNNEKIEEMYGQVKNKKWKPTSVSQLCLENIDLDLSNPKAKNTLKILTKTKINKPILECTIPINNTALKSLIPIPQTCNLRDKEDGEPSGYVHFQMEYVNNYESHKAQVIEDLEKRREGLKRVLNSISDIDSGLLDQSLEIGESWESSFLSEHMK